ncbi:type II secretion system protein GspM [Xenophilus azovorans]|uniref:type II secretion system protein GspM n=1 Tax=Xenophilus TaxID=151754 RepID=UPI00056FC1CA|nr:type II secretion system protein GspM [Xenophilus azovorans]
MTPQASRHWRTWWAALAPREQRLVAGAAALVVLALLWWVALAPALRTLAAAPQAHARLDAQWQQMAALQAQARALQAQPKAGRDDALRALEASVRDSLGADARVQAAGGGEAVGIVLRGVPAEALADWLAQARSNARAVPREVHLTRSAATGADAAAAKAPGTPAAVRWDGTLVMNLPNR